VRDTDDMLKPELVMKSKPEDDFLTGVCSACSNVRFNLTGNSVPQKALLREMFTAHVQGVHETLDGDSAK